MECIVCKGLTEKKNVNYILDLNNTIIIIKDVPANVCTKCGERYFDDDVMENLEKIVNNLRTITTEMSVVSYKENVA